MPQVVDAFLRAHEEEFVLGLHGQLFLALVVLAALLVASAGEALTPARPG